MSQNLEIFHPLVQEIQKFVAPVFELQVTDDASMKMAQEAGKTIQGFLKKIEDRRKALVKPLDDQRDIIQAQSKEVKAPLEKAKALLSERLTKHGEEIERVRVEALRRQQEEDRLRQQREAEERERVRRELEAKQLKEAEEAAAAAQAMGLEEDHLEVLEKAHQQERMQTNMDLTREAVASQAQAEQEMREIANMKVSGMQKPWVFKITDEKLVPREFLMVDEKKIREAIRMGARSKHIPGVEIYQEAKVVFKS